MKVHSNICSVLLGVGLLATWQILVVGLHIPNYLLPTPLEVFLAGAEAFSDGYIWQNLLYTAESTLAGFACGAIFGLVSGAIIAEWPQLEKVLYPYIVLFQSMPKVALAPLLIVWLGYGLPSKIALVALISFFPVFVNTFVSLKQVDADLVDVLRVSSASRLQIFLHIKLPAAAGGIFASLQVAISLSLIGAVVAEFVASKYGLGTMIQQGALNLDTGLMLTGVFILALMGMLGSAIIRAIHKRVVFWEISEGALSASERGEL